MPRRGGIVCPAGWRRYKDTLAFATDCSTGASRTAESSSPEASAHPPMQRLTSDRREERQAYIARSIGSSTGCLRKRSDGPLRVCHHCNPQTTHATAWSRPRLSAARTRTRSRRRQQLRPFVAVTEPGRNSEMSIHNEKVTHPRTSPQQAYCPGTWGSDRDHHPAPGNDRIQRCTGDTLSETRPNSSLQRRNVKFARCNIVFKKMHPWMHF